MDTNCRALLLCVCLISLWTTSLEARSIDCRKYIFAPVCRGVSAKRSSPTNGAGDAQLGEPDISVSMEPEDLPGLMEALASSRMAPWPVVMGRDSFKRAITRKGRARKGDQLRRLLISGDQGAESFATHGLLDLDGDEQ